VAVRLTDSDQYQEWEDMMNDIELHYADLEANMTSVTKMEPNLLYLARIERTWMRVQLCEVMDNDKVKSFFNVKSGAIFVTNHCFPIGFRFA
jgi:hypothetical protein